MVVIDAAGFPATAAGIPDSVAGHPATARV
jgi:hypothetical protein